MIKNKWHIEKKIDIDYYPIIHSFFSKSPILDSEIYVSDPDPSLFMHHSISIPSCTYFFTFLCYTCVVFMCNKLFSLCFVLLPWFPIFFHTTILIVHEPFDIVINFFLRIIIKELNQRFILPYLLRLCTTIFYTLLNFIIAPYSPLNLKCDLF